MPFRNACRSTHSHAAMQIWEVLHQSALPWSSIDSMKPLIPTHLIQVRTSEFLILNHFANSNYQQPAACSTCEVPKKSWKEAASGDQSGTPLASQSCIPRQSGFRLKMTDSGSRVYYVHTLYHLQIGLQTVQSVTCFLSLASFPT